MYRNLMGVVGLTILWSGCAKAGPVDIGSLSGFAVFAGATITDTGTSIVTGDVGLSPGSAITGFALGAITGVVHVNDNATLQAVTDWGTAATAIKALPCSVQLTGQDLGGMTLTAGVYCFTSSAQLTGKLTLTAGADPAAQFIFKIGSALTTTSNAAIVFTGGASVDQLLWLTGTSTTLGTGTQFAGSILADASISLNTGASLIGGRALAHTGAVTLDGNRIAVPAIPDAVPEPAAWALMMTGFACTGLRFRRRRAESTIALGRSLCC